MTTEIELKIEPHVEDGATRRGFRWVLREPDEWPLFSKEVFATRREAERAGEAALKRARERGRIR